MRDSALCDQQPKHKQGLARKKGQICMCHLTAFSSAIGRGFCGSCCLRLARDRVTKRVTQTITGKRHLTAPQRCRRGFPPPCARPRAASLRGSPPGSRMPLRRELLASGESLRLNPTPKCHFGSSVTGCDLYAEAAAPPPCIGTAPHAPADSALPCPGPCPGHRRASRRLPGAAPQKPALSVHSRRQAAFRMGRTLAGAHI